jgi:hypothetical protein
VEIHIVQPNSAHLRGSASGIEEKKEDSPVAEGMLGTLCSLEQRVNLVLSEGLNLVLGNLRSLAFRNWRKFQITGFDEPVAEGAKKRVIGIRSVGTRGVLLLGVSPSSFAALVAFHEISLERQNTLAVNGFSVVLLEEPEQLVGEVPTIGEGRVFNIPFAVEEPFIQVLRNQGGGNLVPRISHKKCSFCYFSPLKWKSRGGGMHKKCSFHA